MAKISVIIPVYNASEFLPDTMESVLSQSLEDIEVIAVNDGSTDDSENILKEYASEDARVNILNQKNSGPSAARNNGLDHATGEFVFFLDSDDLLTVNALEKMYNKADELQADMIIGKYDIFNGVRYAPVKNINALVKKDDISKYDRDILWTFALWNKLFRRAVIEENHLRFVPVSYSEDGVFVLSYLQIASKISGCNSVVIHYRRMPFAKVQSITMSVELWKVRDYLQAHRIMYLDLKRAIQAEFPQYSSFEEILLYEEEPSQYIGEFLKKEIITLVNQFYKKFWNNGRDIRQLLETAIINLLNKTNMDIYYQVVENFPELCLEHPYVDFDKAVAECKVAVVLFGTSDRREEFIRCLRSLCIQTFIPVNMYVPLSMQECAREADINQANVIFIESDSRADLYDRILNKTSAEYILFADDAFSYEGGAILHMYRNMQNMSLDIYDNVVNVFHEDKAVACSWHARVVRRMKNYRTPGEYSERDALLPNKMFKVSFLRESHADFSADLASLALELMKKGYFSVTERVNVIFEDGCRDKDFISWMRARSDMPLPDEDSEIDSYSLSDPGCLTDIGDVYRKLTVLNTKKRKGRGVQRLMNILRKMPLKDQVLFFSIRTDGKLEGNLKAIYKLVHGKKVVCAQRLPHRQLWKLRMYYEFAVSKLIVIDDYARYLRLFPLKPEQRVIQLWHACGAFKKFGLQGTTLSVKLEKATHVQYNLVSVSSQSIRSIYARAFNIDVEKVAALGTPRTDIYFDDAGMEEKRSQVFDRYPCLENREVILYAPTFRDKNADRTVFRPQINFEDLSRRLGDDKVFVIAPHPLMTAAILSSAFDNIIEIRDISTNDLMFAADVMVTDYSSVIFEYALLRRPIVFYCYDKKDYDRGFYLDFDRDLPGEIFETYEDFAAYIEDSGRHVITESHNQFIEKYMSACDGHSSERIAGIINDYMGAGK